MATSALVSSPRKRRNGQRERLTLTSIRLSGGGEARAFAVSDASGNASAPAPAAADFRNARRLISGSAAASDALADAASTGTTAAWRARPFSEGAERSTRGECAPVLLNIVTR